GAGPLHGSVVAPPTTPGLPPDVTGVGSGARVGKGVNVDAGVGGSRVGVALGRAVLVREISVWARDTAVFCTSVTLKAGAEAGPQADRATIINIRVVVSTISFMFLLASYFYHKELERTFCPRSLRFQRLSFPRIRKIYSAVRLPEPASVKVISSSTN